eukprot:TRINITY_DN60_c0_g1_i1.p1 TRINITY_DN60_c0_g1~~TRINITY_DN60_c0_g1_i1.p1  ORF type:complete len:121 (+),score=0.80 TRINITY_DN60_c0_g1_i1:113-475(+)
MSASLSIPGVQGVLYSSGLSNPVKSQFTTLKSQCEKQSACATGIGSNAAFIISVRQPKRFLIRRKVAENASSAKKKSILCNNCEGNGKTKYSLLLFFYRMLFFVHRFSDSCFRQWLLLFL